MHIKIDSCVMPDSAWISILMPGHAAAAVLRPLSCRGGGQLHGELGEHRAYVAWRATWRPAVLRGAAAANQSV